MRHFISSIVVLLMFQSCVDQTPAPIEYNSGGRSNGSYSSNSKDEKTVDAVSDYSGSISGQPIKKENFEPQSGNLESQTIHKDDEIQANHIKEDDLKIIYHEVQNDETLEQIAQNYSSNSNEIAKLNNLPPPYKLEEFQIIKIKVTKEVLNAKNQGQPIVTKKGAGKFHMPVSGKIITKFGEQMASGRNNGVNIQAELGSPIESVADGTVVYSGFDNKFGNLIIVKLNEGDLYAAYAHMESLSLKKGDEIKTGDLVGKVGKTGNIEQPQLHFAIREGKKAVDPMKYLQ